MKRLSKRDREIVTLVSEGMSEFDVRRRFGLREADLDRVYGRVAALAETTPVNENAAVFYERTLRRRAENTAKSLESRFRALMDASTDAILVVNGSTGTIDQVNANACEMFGYRNQDLIGLSVEELVPESARTIHPAYRIGFMMNVRKRAMGYHPPIFARRADGTLAQISIGLTASGTDDEVMVVCSLVTSDQGLINRPLKGAGASV